MNTYPGFYRCEDGSEYLYLDKANYFSFERGIWDKSGPDDNHKNDTNITLEYLANTKVEIESEEHKEFILKLLNVNDLYFSYLSGTSFIYISGVENTVVYNPKEIHIPLPPKEHEEDANITRECLAGSWVKVESESHGSLIQDIAFKAGYRWRNAGKEKQLCSTGYIAFNEHKTIISLSPIPLSEHKEITIPLPPKDDLTAGPGLTLTGSTLDVDLAKKPEPKEWPQVGDEVVTASKLDATVIAIDNCEAWVKYKGKPTTKGYGSVSIATLTKPPTPEEELATKITQLENFDITGQKALVLAKAIINGEIKGLCYKPE